MWLAEKAGAEKSAVPDIQIGKVTIGGGSPAVMLDGEKRNVALALPGGYGWEPKVGDEVLVLKSEGEWFIVARAAGGGDCTVTLSGEVNISGSLKVNGVDISELISAMGGDRYGAEA